MVAPAECPQQNGQLNFRHTNNSGEALNILTVCTGNICRSPMAEGILRLTDFPSLRSISVSSAGTHAINGNPATEFAILASGEKGIDLSEHRARLLDLSLVSASDVILCMEPSQVEWVLSLDSSAFRKIYNLGDFSEHGSGKRRIDDPYGCSLREFRLCFDEIEKCSRNFLVFYKRQKNLLA